MHDATILRCRSIKIKEKLDLQSSCSNIDVPLFKTSGFLAYSWKIMVILIYHINCSVMQGFLALKEAVTAHLKKYDNISPVFDIANQFLIRHSSFAPLFHVNEWTAKPSPFSIQGRLSKFSLIMAAKTLKKSYRLQTVTFKIF